MRLEEAMDALKRAGTAQNRKVYARHGVGENQFGVSYANLNKIAKKIGTDHELARRLWGTGNHDARVLATMLADPARLSAAELDQWVKDLDNYVVTDAFSSLVGRSPSARRHGDRWIRQKGEWVGQAGWNVVSHLAIRNVDIDDDFFENRLAAIERDIHQGRNRVRHAMNNALIAIGLRNRNLKGLALAAAKRIGTVQVDHGETSCKTPAAGPYIERGWARKRDKAKRASSRGKPTP